MRTEISIIIPVKNGVKGGIERCLAGIFSQKIDKSFEVIAIDSGSTDGTLEVLAGYPHVKLSKIKPEEFGHGRTRNLGASMSAGSTLVFINQDAWPANDHWLSSLIAPLEQDEAVAGVYSRQTPKPGCYLYVERDMLTAFGEKKIVKSREDLEPALADKGDLFRSNVQSVVFFSTVSAAIRRSVWEKVPFDDEIEIAEDQDWAKKALLAGFKTVYEPDSKVFHSHNRGLKELFVPGDPTVKIFDRILERKRNTRFAALPYLLHALIFRVFSDIPYILARDVPLVRKMREICIAVSSRCVNYTGRALAILLLKS